MESAYLNRTEEEIQDWVYDVCKVPIFVDAPIHTDRQRNQYGNMTYDVVSNLWPFAKALADKHGCGV